MSASTGAIDFDKLPRKALPTGTELFRIHRAIHGAWFFDGSGDGRFDPTGSADSGACYWALDPLGAWVEVFRTRMVLTEADLASRRLSVARLDQDLDYVDLSDRGALAAGVTAAITSGADYADSHALGTAVALKDPAVVWRVRHDLAQELLGVALFGPRGAVADSDLKIAATRRQDELPEDLVSRACAEFGYIVLPDPEGP